ncbi:MAG: DUF1189 family protein [Legionellaceae bacterium]|nr:DUF1189 family protein [Legionellaceae bacterium]
MFKRKQKMRLIDARVYRYWQALYLSLYSRRLYVDVAKRWKGLGLMYCLLLMVIAAIPLSVRSIIDFNQYIGTDLIQPLSEVPTFNIKDGKVIFEGKMPYYVKNNEGQEVVIIDTTGQITHITYKYPKLVMLVTSDHYYFRAPKLRFLKDDKTNRIEYEIQKIQSYSMKHIKNGVFDAKTWIETSDLLSIKNGLLLFVYPFLVSSMFGIFATILIVLAMMGQVASYTIFKYKLKFKPACRIMMVSSSVGTSLFLCFKAAQLNSSLMNSICVMIVFAYFSFAVLSVKRESKQLVHI